MDEKIIPIGTCKGFLRPLKEKNLSFYAFYKRHFSSLIPPSRKETLKSPKKVA